MKQSRLCAAAEAIRNFISLTCLRSSYKINRIKYGLFIPAAAIFTVLAFTSCTAASGDKLAKNGKELYLQGSFSEALENLSSAEEKGIKTFNEAELYCYMGNCYYQLGNYEKSIDCQLKCLDKDPEYFSGWVNLGVAYKKSNEDDKAMTCYEVALNYDPENNSSDSGLLYISLGTIYLERGKPVSAITYLEKARDIYSGENESSTVYAYLSIAYKMALEPEKSAEAFDKAKALGYPKMDEIQEQLDKLD